MIDSGITMIILLCMIPVSIAAVFIVSLVFYFRAKKTASETGNARDIEKMKNILAISRISGTILVVLVLVAAILAGLFFLFIMNM